MAILRYEENGIEFFTLEATGESGMSQSGLARLCGVDEKSVRRVLNLVRNSSCPEFLKPLQDMDLTLRASVNEFNNATILKDSVCAHILEWYAFESQRPSETARQAFRQFASLGIRSWIQGITGWQCPAVLEQPVISVQPSLPSLEEIERQLSGLEHSLMVALKHRHAIHNLVEQPTVVDLSLQQIVHTAVHVQAHKLNLALKQVAALRQLLVSVPFFSSSGFSREEIAVLMARFEQLQTENEALARRLAKLQGRRSTLTASPEEARMDLGRRIDWLTSAQLTFQKRPNSERAIAVCRLRATILARFEQGESLIEIADQLGMPYETAKTYLKRIRELLRPQLVPN